MRVLRHIRAALDGAVTGWRLSRQARGSVREWVDRTASPAARVAGEATRVTTIVAVAAQRLPAQALLVRSQVRADAALGVELMMAELRRSWPRDEKPPEPVMSHSLVRAVCSEQPLEAPSEDVGRLRLLLNTARYALARNPGRADDMLEADNADWLAERIQVLLADNPVEIDVPTLAVQIGLFGGSAGLYEAPWKQVGSRVRTLVDLPFLDKGTLCEVSEIRPHPVYARRPRLSLSPVKKLTFTTHGTPLVLVEPENEPDRAAEHRRLLLRDEET